MFILLTTANYPDIMMLSIAVAIGRFVLCSFLILGLYILMSLVLAVIYTHFASRSREKYREFCLAQRSLHPGAQNVVQSELFPKWNQGKSMSQIHLFVPQLKKVERNEDDVA